MSRERWRHYPVTEEDWERWAKARAWRQRQPVTEADWDEWEQRRQEKPS